MYTTLYFDICIQYKAIKHFNIAVSSSGLCLLAQPHVPVLSPPPLGTRTLAASTVPFPHRRHAGWLNLCTSECARYTTWIALYFFLAFSFISFIYICVCVYMLYTHTHIFFLSFHSLIHFCYMVFDFCTCFP